MPREEFLTSPKLFTFTTLFYLSLHTRISVVKVCMRDHCFTRVCELVMEIEKIRTSNDEKDARQIDKASTATCQTRCGMPSRRGNYAVARGRLIAFLQAQGFKPHPNEVFCPTEHCWVDVGALKGQDYWAFEYKSRNDSIRRGLEQCHCYAEAFNYVVLVVDRHRATSSPYFGRFKSYGFGVWSHTVYGFYQLLNPKRRSVARRARVVIERQFSHLTHDASVDSSLTNWLVAEQHLCSKFGSTISDLDLEIEAPAASRSSTRLSGSPHQLG
jgi:hypothetical protein